MIKWGISENVTENVTGVSENVTDKIRMAYKDAGKRRSKLLDIICGNTNISVPEMAKIVGMSRCTILRDIETLKAEGKLRREGNEKKGSWIVSTLSVAKNK